ncbi:MAG: HlyD family efflux transporter periplasmic adaptor subunit [Candidatus Sericytochromatia bacterium]|nr:HlyD family efflux transporter periplasmic adaptor subunit [Candidatus Sericytochromatia bacterium]
MKRFALPTLLALLLLGAGLGWSRWQTGQAIAPERLVTAVRGDLTLRVSETGRVQPLTKVDIRAKVAGQVAEVRVKEGQRVKRGEVLLTIESRDYARALAQADADLAMVRAELEALQAGPRREEVAEARALLAEARARARQAREERHRARQALAVGALTPREWGIAQADDERGQASVEAAASRLARLGAGARAPELAQVRARLRKAEVARQAAWDQLSDTTVRSPLTGTVIHRAIEVGEMVTPGGASQSAGSPLLTVADLGRLVVESEVNQADIARVSLGQPVQVRLETLSGKTLQGQVYKLAPAAEPHPTQRELLLFPVQVLLSTSDTQAQSALRPGMRADLDILTAERKNVVLLPVEAVRRKPDRRAEVSWLPAGKRDLSAIQTREVFLGAQSDSQVEIRQGLESGDLVYIDPTSASESTNRL